jgi:hypothetical protein
MPFVIPAVADERRIHGHPDRRSRRFRLQSADVRSFEPPRQVCRFIVRARGKLGLVRGKRRAHCHDSVNTSWLVTLLWQPRL